VISFEPSPRLIDAMKLLTMSSVEGNDQNHLTETVHGSV